MKSSDIPAPAMKSIAAILTACALVTHGWAAEWAWLELGDGPPGEATDEAHPDWMVITGYGLEGRLVGGEPGSFELEKPLDRASPKLFEACLTGTMFPSARLDISQPATDELPEVFARLELRNVRITGIDSGGGPDGVADQFTLVFEEIRYSYFLPGTKQGQGLFANVNLETGDTRQGVIGDVDPEPPPTWFTVTLGRSPENPDLMRLSWPSAPGVEYAVEWSPDLKTRFEPLHSVTASGASTHIDLPMVGTMGFFRIALP